MNKLVDLGALNVKQGTYRTGSTSALRDPNLLAIARMRRRQMSQMMVALDHAASKHKLPPGQYVIMKKIDGEFTCLVWRDGEVVSLNPYGTARAGGPFHAEFAKHMIKAKIKSAIIGGELYVDDPTKRTRVHDVCRIARAPDSEAEVASLKFAAFGIYDLDGVDLSMAPVAQTRKLAELFKGGTHVHPIEAIEGAKPTCRRASTNGR